MRLEVLGEFKEGKKKHIFLLSIILSKIKRIMDGTSSLSFESLVHLVRDFRKKKMTKFWLIHFQSASLLKISTQI